MLRLKVGDATGTATAILGDDLAAGGRRQWSFEARSSWQARPKSPQDLNVRAFASL